MHNETEIMRALLQRYVMLIEDNDSPAWQQRRSMMEMEAAVLEQKELIFSTVDRRALLRLCK